MFKKWAFVTWQSMGLQVLHFCVFSLLFLPFTAVSSLYLAREALTLTVAHPGWLGLVPFPSGKGSEG